MKAEVAALWDRALTSLSTAAQLVSSDPDAAASRAYYAAFYAVSALFAARGTTFAKHTAVAVAVHRDLVHHGNWPAELGEAYSWLMRIRQTGDYGLAIRVQSDEAEQAVRKARMIVDAVGKACGGLPA